MRKVSPSGHCRLALQLMAAGTLATLMSGCSSDVTRLTDPFSNPFSTAANDEAPVAAPRHVASNDVIPAGRTPPVSSQALAPRSASVAYNAPISRETTGSIDPGSTRMASGPSFGKWTTTGGTPIQVADGETADVLASRYGVPTSALLQVNGLRASNEMRPGSRITIPVYSSSAPRTDRVAENVTRIEARPVRASGQDRIVAPREPPSHGAAPESRWATGAQPARMASSAPGRLVSAPLTEPAHSGRKTTVLADTRSGVSTKLLPMQKIGSKPVTSPGETQARTKPSVVAQTPVVEKMPVSGKAVPAAKPVMEATRPAEPAPAAPAPAVGPVASADGSPEFRWPARGRIIQGFKSGSGGNDGINIAVPEGTSVRAAEGGVVAYAGSELKGYGNLVLIRHPNGFVSAYANNGAIDVKRGETVKRGQEIAKSGQSGNVSSPQLHFELRKGSTPVDPTQFLAGL